MSVALAQEAMVCGFCPEEAKKIKATRPALLMKDCNGNCQGRNFTICGECTDNPMKSMLNFRQNSFNISSL